MAGDPHEKDFLANCSSRSSRPLLIRSKRSVRPGGRIKRCPGGGASFPIVRKPWTPPVSGQPRNGKAKHPLRLRTEIFGGREKPWRDYTPCFIPPVDFHYKGGRLETQFAGGTRREGFIFRTRPARPAVARCAEDRGALKIELVRRAWSVRKARAVPGAANPPEKGRATGRSFPSARG